jgi:AraC-like DNA-binding protein
MRTLQRECERAHGKTPTELIRELRCRLALELVSQGYTNKEISVKLHFASPTHFCHDFRKIYPRSPRQEARQLSGLPG